jgi:hypothetical protein
MADAGENKPIPGQSHWCDGDTASKKAGKPFRHCNNVVNNDSDHCAAGHPNEIRSTSYPSESADLLSDNIPSGESSYEIHDLAMSLSPTPRVGVCGECHREIKQVPCNVHSDCGVTVWEHSRQRAPDHFIIPIVNGQRLKWHGSTWTDPSDSDGIRCACGREPQAEIRGEWFCAQCLLAIWITGRKPEIVASPEECRSDSPKVDVSTSRLIGALCDELTRLRDLLRTEHDERHALANRPLASVSPDPQCEICKAVWNWPIVIKNSPA